MNRDEVRGGADELGVDFDEHARFLVAALEEHAGDLGLEGSTGESDGAHVGEAGGAGGPPAAAGREPSS